MNYFKKEKINTEEKGFVVLIAVLVSGLLITVGVFIANIAIKEITLSNSSQNSQRAFYAADSAAECVLYQDIKLRQFATSTFDTAHPTEIICNNTIFPIEDVAASTNGTQALSIVRISFTPQTDGATTIAEDNYPFAIVSIEKENIGTPDDRTVIRSRGFNVKRNSQNRVERAIQINY